MTIGWSFSIIHYWTEHRLTFVWICMYPVTSNGQFKLLFVFLVAPRLISCHLGYPEGPKRYCLNLFRCLSGEEPRGCRIRHWLTFVQRLVYPVHSHFYGKNFTMFALDEPRLVQCLIVILNTVSFWFVKLSNLWYPFFHRFWLLQHKSLWFVTTKSWVITVQSGMFEDKIYIFETARKKEYIELCCTVPCRTFRRHWNLSHTFFIFPSQLDDLASAIHSLRSPFICR